MNEDSQQTGLSGFWERNVDLIVASSMVIAGTLIAAAGNRDIKDVMTIRKERKQQELLKKAEQQLVESETIVEGEVITTD